MRFMMPGLEKLLKGVLKYRAEIQPAMVKQFKEVADHPDPKALVFSCMDSRVLLTRVLSTEVGEMFLVRNAGNLVPHAKLIDHKAITTDAGALELACVINNVKNVIVCGHSDCKAMNLLFSLRDKMDGYNDSPLQTWLRRHGASSITKYEQFEVHGNEAPIEFKPGPIAPFTALIDPENKFNVQDKLSQVNTLQQVMNIASYPFMKDKLKSGDVCVHAMWFDVYTGDFYLFSKKDQQFIVVTENNYDKLSVEALGARAK